MGIADAQASRQLDPAVYLERDGHLNMSDVGTNFAWSSHPDSAALSTISELTTALSLKLHKLYTNARHDKSAMFQEASASLALDSLTWDQEIKLCLDETCAMLVKSLDTCSADEVANAASRIASGEDILDAKFELKETESGVTVRTGCTCGTRKVGQFVEMP